MAILSEYNSANPGANALLSLTTTDWLTEPVPPAAWQWLSVPILTYGHRATELDCVSLMYDCCLHIMFHISSDDWLAHANISTPDGQLQSMPHSDWLCKL